MKSKAVIILARIVVFIGLITIYSALVRHVTFNENKDLGIFKKTISYISKFPGTVKDVFDEIINPERLIEVDTTSIEFKGINKLEYDLFAMNAYYQQSSWVIELMNLRNDSVLHQWYQYEKDFNHTERVFRHARPLGPIMLKNRSLIVHNIETFNLFRLDAESNIVWHNTEHQVHHAINMDQDGNIWACAREVIDIDKDSCNRTLEKADFQYLFDYIVKIDGESGQTLYQKSIKNIFVENDLGYLAYDYGGGDPFHLNDIEPVLEDGKYWKAGDIFISLRAKSLIFLYRPSTNKILRTIRGPFYLQHDVDIQTDSTIVLFNNNCSYFELENKVSNVQNKSLEFNSKPNPTFEKISEVLVYNLNDSSYTSVYPNQFISNQIFTPTNGLQHLLSNGDIYVESHDEGKIYIFNEDEVLLKKYYRLNKERSELPNWVRIYEDVEF